MDLDLARPKPRQALGLVPRLPPIGAGNLLTAVGEVFGDLSVAEVCPSYRVALLRPKQPIVALDLRSQGAAMAVGALPSLSTGEYPRARTQQWARAVYEDLHCDGIYYNAAHSNGPALALWDTDDRVEIVSDHGGVSQNFALTDPRVWPRIVQATMSLGLGAKVVAECPRCVPTSGTPVPGPELPNLQRSCGLRPANQALGR